MPTPGSEGSGAYDGCRVLVTGAAGFIGRHLCHALLGLGADVTAAGRRERPAIPGCTTVACDLARPGEADRLLAAAQPQVVFHLAAHVTGRSELELVAPALTDTLAAGVLLLAAAAREGRARVVLVGSSEEPSLAGVDTTPASPYAAAKVSLVLWARMFRQYGLDVAIVRPSLVYGPGQAPEKLIPSVVAAALAGERAVLRTPERLCDPIYVDDVVRGLLHAGTSASLLDGELELRRGDRIRVDELARLVSRLAADGTAPPAEPRRIDSGHWAPAWTLEAGLAATIAAYREAKVNAGAVR